MHRDQYNLYVSNISDRTNADRLHAFFSQFGKIERFTYLRKNSRRRHAAVLITYAPSTDLDAIIERNQSVNFDNHNLFLCRTLPRDRPAFERFMTSKELLVSLPARSTDRQFNESSLREYFSKYGSIVSCRMVLLCTTFLIDFVNSSSVDRAILDDPHFYNDDQLIVRKYVSPSRVRLVLTRKVWADRASPLDRHTLSGKACHLKDAIEAIRFGQKVELQLIKCSCERKKIKLAEKEEEQMIELRQRSSSLTANVQRLRENVSSLRESLRQSQRVKQDLIRSYSEKIANERRRIEQLTDAIALLQCL